MNNLKEKIMTRKEVIAGVTGLMVLAPSFCSATGGETAAITSAITKIQTDVVAAITAVAPIAIAIMGIFLVWKYAIRFFKSISK